MVNIFFGTGLKLCSLCSLRYLWSADDIEEAEKATVLFAADVIYSDDLTDLFFDTVKKLMSSGAKKVSSYSACILFNSKVLI